MVLQDDSRIYSARRLFTASLIIYELRDFLENSDEKDFAYLKCLVQEFESQTNDHLNYLENRIEKNHA